MSEKSSENEEQSAKNVPSTVFESNLTHVRNDSAFSMDSFVLQAKTAVSEDADETEEDDRFDDTTASNPSQTTTNVAQQQQQQQHSRRNSSGQSSADSGMHPPPSPVHNFFKVYAEGAAPEDAAPSDGSIVFNYTPPPAVQSLSRNDRSRFPSFDSIGSSGSVVRKAPPARNTKLKAPTTPTTPTTPSGQSNRRKILPYHERRKLMQQRQAQEQSKPPAAPPRPPSGPPPGPPFMMPQNQPFPQHAPPNMYPPFPPPQAYGIPPPPHNFAYPPPPVPPNAVPHYPPPPGAYPPIPMDPRQPTPQQQYPIPPNINNRGRPGEGDLPPAGGVRTYTPRRQSSGQYSARPPIQPLPPYQRSNSGGLAVPASNKQSTPAAKLPYALSSSFDSSDTGNNESRKDLPPPPPPPPMPPPPATHIREDSSGSVSSLGSGTGTEQQQQQQLKPQQQTHSFFERISSWKASKPPKEHSVSDFHRKNQAFLSKMEKQHHSQNSSPRSLTGGSPGQTARRRWVLRSTDCGNVLWRGCCFLTVLLFRPPLSRPQSPTDHDGSTAAEPWRPPAVEFD